MFLIANIHINILLVAAGFMTASRGSFEGQLS
jgi:hypothetical protein